MIAFCNESGNFGRIACGGPARLGHEFGSRAGVVEVVYNGRVLQEVDPVPGEAHEFVPEGFAGESFATFGERGWYGGSLDQSPSIISADQGAEWTVQHVEFRGQAHIRSIDFRDPSNGVACGAGAAPGEFEDHLVCVTNGVPLSPLASLRRENRHFSSIWHEGAVYVSSPAV